MLKNLSRTYESVDNLKPVAQRERQVIIDIEHSEAMCYIIVDASVGCMQWYKYIKRKIDNDGWI
jgi:hypothetical protein